MPVDPAAAKVVFLEAAAIDDPDARAALVGERCGADPDLRARVDALLAANDRALAEEGTATFGPGGPAGPGPAEEPAADHPGRDLRPGAVVGGRYTLVEPVGEGGMGAVWRARQSDPVKRFVAVKLIKAGMDSKQVLARFEAERQALALMDHPHIAKVLDGGLHDGRPFFVMELVKGVPITEFCDARRLTPKERLGLFVPVCQAIQHAHQKGVIHRDIKPSNVLVALYDDRPVPKVIDFGVAKATGGALTERTLDTGFGGVVGTPEYMSPEQATFNNLDVDTRSDVYALGVLLYELLAGSPPFGRKELERKGLLEVLRVVREEEPPRPSTKLSTAAALPSIAATRGTEPRKLTGLLKNELDWIVMKALEKDRARRYETANGFAADVQRYLTGEPVQAHPPTAGYRLKKFVRRNRPQVAAAGLVVAALAAGVVGTSLGLVRAERARAAEAEQRAVAEAKEREATGERARAEAAARREADRADGERRAREEAVRNLGFAEKGNAILGSVFAGLDPKRVAETGRPLQDVLRENLGAAARELDGAAVGDPLAVARMQYTLGQSLLGLGEAALAAEVFGKALATRAARLGPDHPDTLASMVKLAEGYEGAGKPDRALPLCEEAVARAKARLGPDHQITLTGTGILAASHLSAGRADRAVPLLEEVVALTKAKLGPDHPDTLTTLNNLAFGYQQAGRADRAVPLLEEVVAVEKAKLGPDHPSTLMSMHNLAVGYERAGRADRAVPLLEEVVALKKDKLGPDHPDTLKSMYSLAVGYGRSGRANRAVPLLEEVLELRRAKLGPDHPDTLATVRDLLFGYGVIRRPEKALPLREEQLARLKATLGPDHPDTLESLSTLALCYHEAGQRDRALSAFQEAAAGLERRQFQHPLAELMISRLINFYDDLDRPDQASAWQRKWAAAVKARSGADSPAYAGELALLGLRLLKRKQWAEAEPLLRECLAIREAKEPDAWQTFNTRSMLGGALLGQKRYAEAEPLLLQGYEGLKARGKTLPKSGGAERRLPEALDQLVELYAATDNPDEAKKWRAERAKYPAPKEVAPPPREKK